MKLLEEVSFTYKSSSGEVSTQRVLVLNEDSQSISGISYKHLSNEEVKSLEKLVNDFKEQLRVFGKEAFRKFNNRGIQRIGGEHS